jgi:hypothetical protein
MNYTVEYLISWSYIGPNAVERSKIMYLLSWLIILQVSHLTRYPSRQHDALATGNQLVTMRNSRRMLVAGFRVTWDTVKSSALRYVEFKQRSRVFVQNVTNSIKRSSS